MNDPLKPDVALLSKLGSLITHYREYLSAGGHPYDKSVVDTLEKDPDVIAWMKAMGPLLPVLRR